MKAIKTLRIDTNHGFVYCFSYSENALIKYRIAGYSVNVSCNENNTIHTCTAYLEDPSGHCTSVEFDEDSDIFFSCEENYRTNCHLDVKSCCLYNLYSVLLGKGVIVSDILPTDYLVFTLDSGRVYESDYYVKYDAYGWATDISSRRIGEIISHRMQTWRSEFDMHRLSEFDVIDENGSHTVNTMLDTFRLTDEQKGLWEEFKKLHAKMAEANLSVKLYDYGLLYPVRTDGVYFECGAEDEDDNVDDSYVMTMNGCIKSARVIDAYSEGCKYKIEK